MTGRLSAPELKARLHDGREIAVLDVREHGQYGEGHLFHSVCLPYSRLEQHAGRLVPRPDTPLVLVDDGDESIAALAYRRLVAMGYTDICLLTDGIRGWRKAGLQCFKGVNVPGKTFGELVEQCRHTPVMTAAELNRRQQAGDNLIVLDGRPADEFFKMSIPGAICCPNGELPLRIEQLVPDPSTTVVINCAGRTRSIIGAQTLIDLGIRNPVYALENGTQGWRLAGLTLEHGINRRHSLEAPADLENAKLRAQRMADAAAVPELSDQQAQALVDEPGRSTFVLDVRTPEEFRRGSLAGAQLAPGGQLIQASDQFIGVRHARLILIDDDGVRAPVVAAWMRQLGFDAHTLADGIYSRLRLPAQPRATLPELQTLTPAALAGRLSNDACALIDLRASSTFAQKRLAGSVWTIRSRLESTKIAASKTVVFIAGEQNVAAMAAVDLIEAGLPEPLTYSGPIEACEAAGIPVDRTHQPVPAEQAIDFLFFVHDRHDGNLAASRQYLEWETGLLAQIDADERNGFPIIDLAGQRRPG